MLLGTSSSGIVVPDIDELYMTIGYTGNGNNRTLNYSDLNRTSNEEMVVISKVRTGGAREFIIGSSLFDQNNVLRPKQTSGFSYQGGTYGTFSNTQVIVGSNDLLARNNESIIHHIFRTHPGFMEVVQYTGNGTAGRTVSHDLGVDVGAVWVKRTDGGSEDWTCYWKYLGNNKRMELNNTNNSATSSAFNNTHPTKTTLTLGSDSSTNGNGSSYIAFIFAEDTDSVISCGGFVGNGGTKTITLGWEPGLVLYKGATIGNNWHLVSHTATGKAMNLDEGNEEYNHSNYTSTSTGFTMAASGSQNQNNHSYVYMAIANPT